MSNPEFSRPVPLSDIGAGSVEKHMEASKNEAEALAARFDLISIESLSAQLALYRDGESIFASGRMAGRVTQSCVASAEPVSAKIDEEVRIRFLSESDHAPDAEIELDADDCDVMFHDGRTVDLGEAVAQSLALALDPFPRSPNADATLKAAGVKDEEEAGPFGALAALKDKLGKK
jgi:uncharacterized metal-binding protein YceD (DUF177 family)